MATPPVAPATSSHESRTSSEPNERSTTLAFYAFVVLLALALLAVAWTFATL